MTLDKSLYRGKYTRQESVKNIGVYIGLFLASAMLFIGIWLIGQNSKTVYELPGEEVPILAVPPVNPVIGEPEFVDDLVAVGYDFTIETDIGTFETSCPVIRADFGKEINEYIIGELNHVVNCIQYAVDNGEELPVTGLSYQAYYAQDVLTLVLLEMLEGNEQRSLVWICDLKEDRKLNVHELPERYLGISYTEFLYATDKYIGQRYSDYHFSALQYVPDTVTVEQQHRQNQNYIQTDPINMLGRFIFPTNEGVYLLYEMPLITEEFDHEISMQTVTEPIDSLLPYIDLVSPQEVVRELLFDTAVSVMGADDQIHAELVRTAFREHPEAFVAAATEDPYYAVQRLLLYASQDEKMEFADICTRLKTLNLSAEESDVISLILAEINEGT